MYKRGSFLGKRVFVFLGLPREGVFCDPDSWRLFCFNIFASVHYFWIGQSPKGVSMVT